MHDFFTWGDYRTLSDNSPAPVQYLPQHWGNYWTPEIYDICLLSCNRNMKFAVITVDIKRSFTAQTVLMNSTFMNII